MGDALGKTDDQVGNAIADMKAALDAMIDATGDGDGRGPEIDGLVQDDLNVSLSLSPKKIEEEFTRLRQAAFLVGEDAEVIVKVEEAKHRLREWQGTAADEFRDQLVRIGEFVKDNQYPAVLTGLKSLGALFSLAYHMRQSYYDLAVAVRNSANAEIDQQHDRENKFKLVIGKEIVLAIMGMNPGTAAAAGLVVFVEAVGALTEDQIEGTGADAVIDGYRVRSIGLRETFESNLNQLTARLKSDWEDYVENDADLRVMQPLPPSTDVGSPDFSYEAFWTEEYPLGGPFANQVEVESQRYAEEEEAHDTEINKRLEGRDR